MKASFLSNIIMKTFVITGVFVSVFIVYLFEFSEFYNYGFEMLKKLVPGVILIMFVYSSVLFWFLKKQLIAKQEDLAKRSEKLQKEVDEKIDELRQKDTALFRQSRYVTIGETISNISHQWRQPLNDLWLLIQSLNTKFKAGKLDADKFDTAILEAKKLVTYMSDTIEDFQTFSRPDREKVAFCLNDTVSRALNIAGASLENNSIKINIREDGRYMVYGIPNEFAQAVLNIINNAKDAFKDKQIENKTINIDIDNIAGMIVVSIEDNAGGIDKTVIDKLFEPYVTTKYGKGGTGVGLYITKHAIEECEGGAIEASNGEFGAKFNIILKEVEN